MNKMSKASKLARMKNTVLETTGLTYNTSGQTVELNFTPDVTNPGVSVPLVLAGNTNSGACPAINLHPLTGFPYAHIRDSKPYHTEGGPFYKVDDSSSTRPSFLLPGGGGTTQKYRSREFNERVVDEIGVSMVNVSSDNNDDGGPGTFLTFPTGIYYISGSAPSYMSDRNITYLCNFTKASADTLSNRANYIEIIGSLSVSPTNSGQNGYSRSSIEGRFTVTNNNDSYLLLHGCQTSETTRGLGRNASYLGFQGPTDNYFADLKIWKIG
jgi:hypothetical protein